MEDLSPEPPRRREPESEVLAPYEGTTGSWLDDDCKNWRKQRHTAVRVYVRLRDGLGYDGSYSTAVFDSLLIAQKSRAAFHS